jgi:phosphoglycolate phosphatase-like HAD superfamily hydrolase
MQNHVDPSSIKNIFWDVDGVLADLNHAYYHFLTGHPQLSGSIQELKMGATS